MTMQFGIQFCYCGQSGACVMRLLFIMFVALSITPCLSSQELLNLCRSVSFMKWSRAERRCLLLVCEARSHCGGPVHCLFCNGWCMG